MLASRNVQVIELHEIAAAWGNVAGIIISGPRLSKKGLQFEKLQTAAPELFDNKYPVPGRRLFGWKDTKEPHYLEVKAFLLSAQVETVGKLGDIPLDRVVEANQL